MTLKALLRLLFCAADTIQTGASGGVDDDQYLVLSVVVVMEVRWKRIRAVPAPLFLLMSSGTACLSVMINLY